MAASGGEENAWRAAWHNHALETSATTGKTLAPRIDVIYVSQYFGGATMAQRIGDGDCSSSVKSRRAAARRDIRQRHRVVAIQRQSASVRYQAVVQRICRL